MPLYATIAAPAPDRLARPMVRLAGRRISV